MTLLPGLSPIIAAPMAGGPSTPELVAAVAGAGALGFLAAGYLGVEALDAQLTELERRTDRPYGVNLFVPAAPTADLGPARRYAERLGPRAAEAGVELGPLRWDDDAYPAKLDLILRRQPAAVSFTFGLPSPGDCERVRARGAVAIATVTTAAEACEAAGVGVDALVAQGAEAGGHRGVFRDDGFSRGGGELVARDDLVTAIRGVTELPVVAAGGMASGRDVGAALARGAVAAQLGTGFLCCPEAGTSAVHRAALVERRFTETVVTRAFTGRPARALRNAFVHEFDDLAPTAYPEIHHLTRPLRAAAAVAGDADSVHLWAGTAWRQATVEPAADLIERWQRELRQTSSHDDGSGHGRRARRRI